MKLLSTTDFSDNSAAALRFAIQISAQRTDVELTFFHSYHVLKPSAFSEAQFEAYEKEKATEIQQQLETFVSNIFTELGVIPGNVKYVIKESVVADSNVVNYAEKEGFDVVCVGARGAGTIEKILGTNTINIINKSSIPVIAVPVDYTFKPVENVLYASDFADIDEELEKVIGFTRPLSGKVEVLHFSFPSEADERNKEALRKQQLYPEYPLSFTVVPNNALKPLVTNIKNYVEEAQPDLLVMFTNPNKSFIEKILFAGNTEDVALQTKIPLLVYKKS